MKFMKLINCHIYSMFFGSTVLAAAIFGNGGLVNNRFVKMQWLQKVYTAILKAPVGVV